MSGVSKPLTQVGLTTGVLILDHNLNVVDINEQFLALTCQNKNELLGCSINKIDAFIATKIVVSHENTDFGHFHTVIKNQRGRKLPVEVCFFSQYEATEKQTLLFIKEVNSSEGVGLNPRL